jgi:hypothetical protein
MLLDMRAMRSQGALAVVGLLLLLPGCAGPEPGSEEPVVLETEDIFEEPSELDLSQDQVARQRKETLAGRLPSSFPDGLPVFIPSSIVDIGEGGKGGHVVFDTPNTAAAVESWLRTELGRSGWSIDADSGTSMTVSRGGQSARISVSGDGPMTSIRVDY